MSPQRPARVVGATPRAQRVWVIGIDGGEFQLLDTFAEHGWMPNLARLMRRGITARLRSTVPPITGPAWTSFLTGCNPGKHGVYAFRKPLRGGWRRPFINATAIRVPRIWQYLEVFGYSSGSINVPMTYPVQPLRGYMVADRLTPDGEPVAAYPEDVQQMLRDRNYVVDLHILRRERELRTEEQIAELADDLVGTIEGRAQAAIELLSMRPTELFAIVFVAPDRIQHHAWQQIERIVQQPEIAERDQVCQRVLSVYRALDEALGELLARCDEQTAIIVMSDHGFCGLHTRVRLNEWLAQNGWLRFRGGAKLARRQAKWGRDWLKRVLPRSLLLQGRRALAVYHTVEWTHTQAYAGDASENAVFLNVAGREPAGIVEADDEYSKLRSEIIAAMTELRDPRSGGRPMTRVYAREQIYSGASLDLAPDIVFEYADGYEFTPEVAHKGGILVDVRGEGRGVHRQEGILIAAGAGVGQSSGRGNAEIMDVAPTALYLLGLPVPSRMDGRVLTEILRPDWVRTRPPEREPYAGRVLVPSRLDEAEYTPDEESLLEERMRSLGYIE